MKPGPSTALVVLAFMLGACRAPANPGSTSEVPPTALTAATTTAPPPTTTTPSSSTNAPSTSTTTEMSGCAAAGLPSVPVDQDLPEEVAEARNAIVAAAVACDVDGLAGLASADFTYSFGGGGDPAGYRSDLETRSATQGSPSALFILVSLLNLPYGTVDSEETTYYVWPSAFGYESWDAVPQADRDALLGLYGGQDFADFEAFGGYVGYRVGIAEDGRWTFFVAGD